LPHRTVDDLTRLLVQLGLQLSLGFGHEPARLQK
jgi:hypothetical protein